MNEGSVVGSVERRPVRVVAVGDFVLDVVVSGDVGAAREARGGVALYPGGSAANFAVGVRRGGVGARFVGKAGNDVAGRLLVGEMEREGVEACVVLSSDAPTGHILVMHEANGDTRMICEPGASATLAPDDLHSAWFSEVDAVHVTAYSLLRSGSEAGALAAVSHVRRESPKALVTLDPAPAHLIEGHRDRFVHMIEQMGVDVLFPNFDEAVALSGETDPDSILAAIGGLAGVVVLKLGAQGCVVHENGFSARVPAVSGPVVDTTGAGDAFAGGFVAHYIDSRNAVAAAMAGAAAATKVVGRMGAR